MGNKKKFRVWDKLEKKMLDELPVGYELSLSGDILFGRDENNSAVVTHQFEVMMYTGINGICEGDIFQVGKHGSINYVVKYLSEIETHDHEEIGACFVLQSRSMTCLFEEFALEYGKVIGNIYENPELLEGSNEG